MFCCRCFLGEKVTIMDGYVETVLSDFLPSSCTITYSWESHLATHVGQSYLLYSDYLSGDVGKQDNVIVFQMYSNVVSSYYTPLCRVLAPDEPSNSWIYYPPGSSWIIFHHLTST